MAAEAAAGRPEPRQDRPWAAPLPKAEAMRRPPPPRRPQELISYARAGAPICICTCIWPGIAPMAIGLIATGCGGMCTMGIGRIPMGCDAGMYIGLAIPGGWCGR